MQLRALFRLAFAPASCLLALNLAAYTRLAGPLCKRYAVTQHSTRSESSPHLRPLLSAGLRPLVGTRFQVLFHSRPRVLFTFPSRYCFTIGRQVVFSLGRWSSLIPTGFLVPHGTWVPTPGSLRGFAYRPFTFSGAPFQMLRLPLRFVSPRPLCAGVRIGPSTPLVQRTQASAYSRFRLFPVRSPLLGESRLLSLPGGTEMFQFSPFAPRTYGAG